MNFLKRLFTKKKDYTIHEIGGGDDDAYITFKIDDVVYMLLLEWEAGGNIMDITFGIEDEYDFDTTNFNKPFTVVNTVYDIVDDIMIYLVKKHKYKFTGVSFNSSNTRGGEFVTRGKDLRDNFFLRCIRRNYPKATFEGGVDGTLFINLYGV